VFPLVYNEHEKSRSKNTQIDHNLAVIESDHEHLITPAQKLFTLPLQ